MKNLNDQSAIIVGVGITSIMVALRLLEAGFKIGIYTKGPDPRINRDVEHHGATGNGRAARFVTGFEGKPHLFDGSIVSDALDELSRPLSDGGWLSKPINEFPAEDQAWLRARLEIAKDNDHSNTLHESYYVKHSKESMAEWLKLQKEKPFLFKDTDISSSEEGVLVLCSSKNLLDATIDQYRIHGFLKQVLTSDAVAKKSSVFEEACTAGHIAGGVMVDGFAFNIHQFIDNAVIYLESQGAKFCWNTEIEKIKIDAEKRVIGLNTKGGELVKADHYSINPGAYGNGMLANTPAQGKICGVAGRWLVMPRPEGFTMPVKILTDNRLGLSIGDNNLTPFMENGRAMLAVSGGSIYVGSDLKNMPTPDVYSLVDIENERIVRLYMSSYYNSAKDKDEIKPWTNTCLRSFTHDDNPLHEVMPTTENGFLTITAGTNTGTTALAPYLADWTTEVLTRNR